jgi:amino acid permease
MAGGGPSIGSYSPFTGFVFIFNLIVGAGALTIPHAFANVRHRRL